MVLVLVLSACDQIFPGESDSTAPESLSGINGPADSIESQPIPELGLEWFTGTQEMADYYMVELESGLENAVLLTPRSGSEDYKLVFVYTKGHKLFDRAVEVVLTTFRGQGLNPSALIIFVADEFELESGLGFAETQGYDLIFPNGSSPTALVFANYQGGQLPVVSLLSKDPVLLGQVPDYKGGSGTNIAFTSVSVPVEIQMQYFLELVPDLKNIILLYDETNSSVITTQVEPMDEYGKEYDLNILHLAITQVEEVEAARHDLNEQYENVMNEFQGSADSGESTVFLLTNSGSLVQVFDTIVDLAGDIPVLSMMPDVVQEGEVSAVMSVGVSFDSNSILAAVYGIQILEDDIDPGLLPVGVIEPPDVAVNFLKSRQIGLGIPFTLFESATYVYDALGNLARQQGQVVQP